MPSRPRPRRPSDSEVVVATSVIGVESRPVILDHDADVVETSVEDDAYVASTGMLQHVRESLLNDAVEDGLKFGGQTRFCSAYDLDVSQDAVSFVPVSGQRRERARSPRSSRAVGRRSAEAW